MGKHITEDQVQKQIAAALKAVNEEWARKYEESQDQIRTLESKIKADAGADANARYNHAKATGDEAFLSGIRSVDALEAMARLGEATKTNGVRMYGDGPGRAALPIGKTAGVEAARMIRALACAEQTKRTALEVAHGWQDKRLTSLFEQNAELVEQARNGTPEQQFQALRALGTEELGSGSSFVQTEVAAEVIPLLQPKTVMRRAGVPMLPLPTGKKRLPFIEEGAEAEYEKECSGPNATQIVDGEIFVERKILTVLVCMCNEWLDESSYAVDALLRDHLIEQMAKKEDINFIRGDGLQNSPFGMSYFADLAGNVRQMTDVSALTGAAKIQAIMNDLTALMALVDCSDVPMDNSAWALACRTKYGLMRCLDGNGNRVFFDEMMGAGTLLGRPFFDTTQIPTDLDTSGGGNDNETEIYFFDASSLRIFETSGIETDLYRDATFRNAQGTTTHGINDRVSVIRAVARHDFTASQRGKEVAKGTELTYGA